MRLRTFTAPDMPTAMKQVREALGDDAIILSSQTQRGKGVTVTAAIDSSSSDEPSESGDLVPHTHKIPASAKSLARMTNEHLRFQIQELLRFHNIPELFIAKIMNADRNAWQSDVRRCLEKLLAAFFRFESLPFFPSPPGRRWREAPDEGSATHSMQNLLQRPHPNPLPEGEGIVLIGPPGIGKTLTIARIAAGLAMDRQKALVITTDTKRAGGIEQLQAFTDIMKLPLAVAGTPKELQRLLHKADACVLIDSAGCNPYDATEMTELTEFLSKIGNIEPVLALPAGGDSMETIDVAEAFMSLPVKKLLVTRADTARRFGGVLAAAAAHGLAFCNASGSSSVTDRLLPMDEALLARLLLRYQLQTR